MPDWLRYVLIGAVVMVVVPLLGRYATRSTSSEDGSAVMRVAPIVKWFGLVGTVFFGSLGVASIFFMANDPSGWWVLAGFLALTALGTYTTLDALWTRHRILDDRLELRSVIRERRTVRWAEVDRVECSSTGYWVLRAGGHRFSVAFTMTNQPAFARTVLERVPVAAIGEEIHPILQAAADGSPPRAF